MVKSRMENEPSNDFPKSSVENVLWESKTDAGAIDYVVFLGKPLSYLERLISTHIEFFPFSFRKFFSDFRDFFGNKFAIRSILKKNLSFNRDICYIEVADAVAYGLSKNNPSKYMREIVVLSDCLSSRIGGSYAADNNRLILERELLFSDNLKETLSSFPGKEQSTILASDYNIDPETLANLKTGSGDFSFSLLSGPEILEYAGKFAFDGIRALEGE